MASGLYWRMAVAGVLALGLWTGPASAQTDGQRAPVSLKNKDGSLSVSGNLVGFEEDYYLVEIENIGILRIDSRAVECTGAGCPILTPEYGIFGNGPVAEKLIPALLQAYGENIGAEFRNETTGEPRTRLITLTDQEGVIRAQVTLTITNDEEAFAAMAGRDADIVIPSDRIGASEAEVLTGAGLSDLRETEHELVIGQDATVMILHPQNSIRNLSALEVGRIYSGEVKNWSELGGPDLPIRVNSLPQGAASRQQFVSAFLSSNALTERGDTFAWSSDSDMIKAVAGDPGGVGYVGRSALSDNGVARLAIRESCGLITYPTAFNIKNGGYFLSRQIHAYKRPGRIHPEAQAFLDWALSDEAQAVIKATGFIDRGLERMRLEDMGMTLIHTAAVEPDFNGNQYAGMMRDLRNADRVSFSFRFLTGSTTLDIDSIRNLEVLAGMLEAGDFGGLEVLLVGFTDSIGDRVRNTQLAAARARVVRENLLATLTPETAERARLLPLSYGELLPLSCNTDEIGREHNRRVEVWLRRPER